MTSRGTAWSEQSSGVLARLVLVISLIGTACTSENADAKTCVQHPNTDVALEACSRAIGSGQLSPSRLATAHYNRGLAYQRRGDSDLAIQDFDRVVGLRPETSKAFYNRGIAYQSKGEFELAIQDFDRVVQLTPDYAPAFRNRGNAYRSSLAFDRAIPKEPREILCEAYYHVGQGLVIRGQRAEAIGMFRAAAVEQASARAELKRLGHGR